VDTILHQTRTELARLDRHFARVLAELHARDTRRLSLAQRRARSGHLERLDAYRRRRVFPKNRRFPGRMLPHFIDESGTRCAMGHLIETSGGRDLVMFIARERNLARIAELAAIPELVAWLEANGISAEEAGRIQPEYCGTAAFNCVCIDNASAGTISGPVVSDGTHLQVDAIYGGAKGVQIGEILPLSDPGGLAAGAALVFASPGSDGTAHVRFAAYGTDGNLEVVVPASACVYPEASEIPGPLPLGIVTEALSYPIPEHCEAVITAFDAAWSELQGACPKDGGAGTGGVAATGGTSGTGGGSAAGGNSPIDGGGATGGALKTSADSASSGCGVANHAVLGTEALLTLSAAAVVLARRLASRR
jgi:hypothetical protein